jgi:SAM-dependent methyltransferase
MKLPFPDATFDFVMNRHEEFSPSEVWRILKNGGRFAAQQVGGTDNIELNRRLGESEDFGFADWHLPTAEAQLEDEGFRILKKNEEHPRSRFYDIGALVYYIKAVPWQFPEFSVEKYFDRLVDMHEEIARNGYLQVHSHRFWLLAEKT